MPAVDGYVLHSLIGRGGFASVYRATQLSLGRTVALKVLDDWNSDPDAEKRFNNECRSVSSLSWHPHIVAVFDAGLSRAGRPFMSMELFDRGALSERIRSKGPMPAEEVCRVGLEVADALAAAHEAGVVHRDIKPANVLIGRRDEYVLGDFGIAALHDATRSATGNFIGTMAFTAPEVLLGERATPAADIFSLGVTLHSLLLGSNTFASGGNSWPGAVVQRVLNEAPAPLPAGVPEWLTAVIEQAIAKNPTDRFSSAQQLYRVLQVGTERATRSSDRSVADEPVPGQPVAQRAHTVQQVSPYDGDQQSAVAGPGWHTDPMQRFEYRWWDGTKWTSYVGSGGVLGIDSSW